VDWQLTLQASHLSRHFSKHWVVECIALPLIVSESQCSLVMDASFRPLGTSFCPLLAHQRQFSRPVHRHFLHLDPSVGHGARSDGEDAGLERLLHHGVGRRITCGSSGTSRSVVLAVFIGFDNAAVQLLYPRQRNSVLYSDSQTFRPSTCKIKSGHYRKTRMSSVCHLRVSARSLHVRVDRFLDNSSCLTNGAHHEKASFALMDDSCLGSSSQGKR
jgi:hypothetical protein